MPYNKTLEEGLKEFEEYMNSHKCFDSNAIELASRYLTTFAEKIREGVVEETIEKIKGIKEETRNFPMKSNGGNWDDWNDGYDKALDDLLAQLKK